METEIPVQRLHKYNLLYQCGAFSPSDISNIFSEVIVDDIVKTNRIAALIKAAEKAAEDYKALQKENEELKQKEQNKDENNKLGRRRAFGGKGRAALWERTRNRDSTRRQRGCGDRSAHRRV
jgi:hypothetical protein